MGAPRPRLRPPSATSPADPRPAEHPRQRHLRWPYQNPRRPRHRRLFEDPVGAVEERSPLHRNVDALEVGNTALFLASDLASGITGEITFVDCGYNITGPVDRITRSNRKYALMAGGDDFVGWELRVQQSHPRPELRREASIPRSGARPALGRTCRCP